MRPGKKSASFTDDLDTHGDGAEVETVLARLRWMREQRIWPNGLRYLWTDAFGVVLLLSLRDRLHDDRYLDEARWLVGEVDRVLGRPRGIRIGEEPDRDGQYFHYLAMWLFALARLGHVDERYRERALDLVHQIHDRFVMPGVGIVWKMLEDLSGPYPGFGLGAIDPFHGYVVYRLLGEDELWREIGQLRELVELSWRQLRVMQDLGLGMLLWLSHFFPEEPWARLQRRRCLETLDQMWIEPPGGVPGHDQPAGYFCREPHQPHVKFAFTNFGVSVGLQSVGAHPERVAGLNRFFAFGGYRSHDEYDYSAITHVMACSSLLPGQLLAV